MNMRGMRDSMRAWRPHPPPNRYPSDVSDEEWAFVAPYLTVLAPDALQRRHELREVFNAVRYSGAYGRPLALSAARLSRRGPRVYQQARRWLEAGCFEALVHDLRLLLRARTGRATARRRRRSWTPACCSRAPRVARGPALTGTSGAKARRSMRAVDTLGHLLALPVTPANADERTPVAALAEQVQAVTGESVELAYVDQGSTGEEAAATAAAHGIHARRWSTLPEAKRGFVLLPRRWVVERSFAWTARFRRLARD